MARTAKHSLSPEAFTALACGCGGAAAIEELRAAIYSRHLRSIAGLIGMALGNYPEVAARAGVARNLQALEDLQRRYPDDARLVLGYPQVGAWANSTLRDIETLAATNPELFVVHLAHLGNVVAAIALRCGEPFEVTGALRHGEWPLPGLGAFAVPCEGRYQIAEIVSDGAFIKSPTLRTRLAVPQALFLTEFSPGWRPLERIWSSHNGCTFDVAIDDGDPYGVDLRVGMGDRLSSAAKWRLTFHDAWHILMDHHPDYARAIGVGLQALVPLQSRGVNEDRSATAADAFGSIMLTMPGDALSAAEVLVHEFQHGQLDGVLGLYELTRQDASGRMYAPWRDDPRPASGLLQGVYAFMGVTDFWRVQCGLLTGEPQRRAWFKYSRWYEPLRATVQELIESGELTELGAQFLGAMQQVLSSWEVEIPDDIRLLARLAACDHRLTWELRYTPLVPEVARRLSLDWLAGRPCLGREYMKFQVPMLGGSVRESQARLDLVHLLAEYPADFERFSTDMDQLARAIPGVTAADVQYAQGNFEAAIEGYQAEIVAAPLRIQAWVGLALAVARQGDDTLLRNLSIVYAVTLELVAAGREVPTPMALASWADGAD